MTIRGRILAIDDESNIRRLLSNELEQEGFLVATAATGEQGLALADKERFDLALVDLKLPGMSGIDVIRRIRHMPFPVDAIVITGHGDIDGAVQSMKLGALDFITKPFKLSELIPLIDQAVLQKRALEQSASQDLVVEGPSRQSILCPSPAMQDIYRQMRKVAPTDATVLIQGETGVGKDVIAHEIHAWSRRCMKPYIVVDCGMLNGNLAESELYGHKKGTFSGASENKTGLVAASDGGTLFLDEIGNIDLEMQKKFLRFLETKTYRRLGDVVETLIDARIILATNMQLTDAARKGTFRSDLLYRLDVICIHIPPLRSRPEDIPALAGHFLKANSGPDGAPVRISSRAMNLLVRYPWPGNVRELRSVIFKTLLFASSSVIEPEDLPHLIASKNSERERFEKTLGEVEKDHILYVLHKVRGNQSKAAKVLGINRRTLFNKIRKHDIFT
ncbi:MAG: sigma-54 dependent transcriptional regulator [Desulfobacteraceae bacterium]|jgi:DNA-binding NtrC family response regulator